MAANAVPRAHSWIVAAGWVLTCEVVGAVSGWLTASEITRWYPTLTKPSFNPPNGIFSPVWTTLYALMGIAAWLVWRAPDSEIRRWGLRLFWVQLALNFLWSIIFFRGHALLMAGVEIVLLFGMILWTAALFWRVSRAAMWLMMPYAAWVGFATVLTWAIWRLNA